MANVPLRESQTHHVCSGAAAGLLTVIFLIAGTDRTNADEPTQAQLSSESRRLIAERDRLWQQAEDLFSEGKTEAAIAVAENVLTIERKVFGEIHNDVAGRLQWLSRQHLSLRQFDEAEIYAQQCHQVTRQLHGNDHWQSVSAQWDLDYMRKLQAASSDTVSSMLNFKTHHDELIADSMYVAAVSEMEELIPLARQILGEEHPDYATALAATANVYREIGKYTQAEQLYLQCRDILKNSLGEGHPDYATVVGEIAYLYLEMGKHTQAEALFRQCRDVLQNTLGSKHADLVATVNNMAQLYREMGKYSLAEITQRKSLEIREETHGKSDELYNIMLLHLAEVYLSMKEVDRAEPLCRQAARAFGALHGKEHPNYLAALHHLAHVHAAREDFDRAESLLFDCLRIRKQYVDAERSNNVAGREHVDYAATLCDIATLRHYQKDSAHAQELYEQALAIWESVPATQGADYQNTAKTLAALYSENGYFSKAQSLYKRLSVIQKQTLGEDHPDYVSTLNSLTTLLLQTGDYASAIRYLSEFCDIQRSIVGENNIEYANAITRLGDACLQSGDVARAERLFAQSQQIWLDTVGEADLGYPLVVAALAAVSQAKGDYSEAEQTLLHAKAICEKHHHERTPQYADLLMNLGNLALDTGEYHRALTLHTKAMELSRDFAEEAQGDYATSLAALAGTYQTLGDFSRAESLYAESVRVFQSMDGGAHLEYLTVLGNVATLMMEQGEDNRAGNLYRTILKQAKLDPAHPFYITCLINCGQLCLTQGDAIQAQSLLQEAWDRIDDRYGRQHPQYAAVLIAISSMFFASGDYNQSINAGLEALKIRRTQFGANHPANAEILAGLSQPYRSIESPIEAEFVASESLNMTKALRDDASVVMSERQQLAMNQMLRHRLDSYVSLALDYPQYQPKAAQEVLQWKGATLVRQRAMRMAAEEPEIADGFAKLQQVSRQLASLARAAPTDGLDEWKQRITDLTTQKESLEAQLSRDSAAFRSAMQQIRPEQIQAAVPADAVLIDFLQFSRSRVGEEKGQLDYTTSLLAVIVKRDGEAQLVELGAIDDLSEAIDTWRESFGMSPQGKAAGLAIRQQIWEPLLGHIGNAKTVLVSTDGALGRLPLAALPGAEPGTYLIEDHHLAMIPVPQLLPDLVRKRETSPTSGKVLLVGGIDYGVNGEGRESPWQQLPGAKHEVATLEDRFRTRNRGNDIVLLKGEAASESIVLSELSQATLLHFATHGLFESQVRRRAAILQENIGTRGATISKVSLRPHQLGHSVTVTRSGLVLAGANRPAVNGFDRLVGSQHNDGILMDTEVLTLPLQDAELVVLSACDTGRGKSEGGEGILGIQRAFQVAGAMSTVSSLWKVDDSATQVLMEHFYCNLWDNGMSRLNALREAQLHILNNPDGVRGARTEGQKAIHRVSPYYWAAFELAGDWR